MRERARIGVVGAGNNTRLKHIPGFQAIKGVQVVAVANRTRESGERVAKQFNIPKVYDNWMYLVQDKDIDAICIGTWPYMHCPVTLAALENDKHVLTEARMALNASEARTMLAAARRKPHLVTQIVPAPHTLKVDRYIRELILEGYIGDILSVMVAPGPSSFIDYDSPLHWRQDFDLSGYNTLVMGIWYEAMMRWVGPATRVTALTRTWVNKRKDPETGLLRFVTVPDHVEILCDLACGATAHLRFSAVTGLAPGQVWLFGSQGTLHLNTDTVTLYGGRRGDKQLKELPVPPDKQGGWRVEEEFINAIRGQEKVTHTSFEDGVRYMDFTEGVIKSAKTGRAVVLPLDLD